jgi:hypothetical protein
MSSELLDHILKQQKQSMLFSTKLLGIYIYIDSNSNNYAKCEDNSNVEIININKDSEKMQSII